MAIESVELWLWLPEIFLTLGVGAEIFGGFYYRLEYAHPEK